MMQPTYPAAGVVADAVHRHFARHIQDARTRIGDVESPPPLAISSIIDAAFWASLRREEGRAPQISMAFLPPEGARHALRFASQMPLLPAALAKLAPAVERPGIHLGVWQSAGDFYVWGTTREVPAWAMITNLRMDPYERGIEEGGEALKFFAQQMWLLVPIQAKIKEFFSDFENFPYQAGSSLNAGGIGYGLLRQEEAMKRLKTVETLTAAGGSGR